MSDTLLLKIANGKPQFTGDGCSIEVALMATVLGSTD